MTKLSSHAGKAIKAMTQAEPVPSAVFLPPAFAGDTRVVHAFKTEGPTIEQNLVRIQNECDPIGFLIAIATGQPIATYRVGADGEINVEYETLSLSDPKRLAAIKHLADKVVPRITMSGKKTTTKGDDSAWEATIGGAAERNK